MTNTELWQTAQGEIELSISKASYITWFQNTKISSRKDDQVIISVPNAFTKEWLENKYNKLILKALRSISKDIKKVKYIIARDENTKSAVKIKKAKTLKNSKPEVSVKEQLNLGQFKVDRKTNLNARYCFSNFVVGSFNELAHAAAQSIIKNPGNTYNPFFVYGGTGSGKTHLLQAIGNSIAGSDPSKKILYVSSEGFTQDVVSAIANKDMEKLKNFYRKVDILIIDDIQFLAKKERTQEEFFHTFNALYENNKQIILSSDRPPKAIPTLEDRLRSRFEGGMIADIGYPDLETRVVILKTKLKELKLELSEEALVYIASNIQNNVRELEGALNKIVAFIRLNNTFPTQDQVVKILKTTISSHKKRINHKDIIKVVSDFYEIAIEEIINRSRRKEMVKPRQVAMYLLRTELKNSYPFIGNKLGGRDHTTAMYACEKIEKQIKDDNLLSEELETIRQQLYRS